MFTVVSNKSLQIHVHATGCDTVRLSKRRLGTLSNAIVEKYEDMTDAAAAFFSGAASDQFEAYSDEWHDYIVSEWNAAARICTCAK